VNGVCGGEVENEKIIAGGEGDGEGGGGVPGGSSSGVRPLTRAGARTHLELENGGGDRQIQSTPLAVD